MKVRDAIAQVQLSFQNATTDVVFQLLRQVHAELCSEFPIERTDWTIPLVSGVREYAIPENVVWIRAAYYQTGEHAGYVLRAATVGALDSRQPSWRFDRSTGFPTTFYVDGGHIGFLPTPSESTQGQYPVVKAAATVHTPLDLEGDLPTNVGVYDVYIDGACYRLARQVAKDQIAVWKSLYEEDMRNLERRLGSRNRRAKDVAYPKLYPGVRQI